MQISHVREVGNEVMRAKFLLYSDNLLIWVAIISENDLYDDCYLDGEVVYLISHLIYHYIKIHYHSYLVMQISHVRENESHSFYYIITIF